MKRIFIMIGVMISLLNVMVIAEADFNKTEKIKRIKERLPKLSETKLKALMERAGKPLPNGFFECLCGPGKVAGGGCRYIAGKPCLCGGPLGGTQDYGFVKNSHDGCIKRVKYDDGTTIIDTIVGALEDLHVETKKEIKEKDEVNIIVDKSFAECPTPSCWVQEARDQLKQALSDPSISREERIRVVKRSARTLKEHGQASAFPKGDIPLKKIMEANYNQSLKEWEGFHALFDLFNKKLFAQKSKLINEMQIEVIGEQISFLIPGQTTFSMSKNLIQTVFDWDVVSGVNKGREGTAIGLVERFRELAKTKKIVKKLDILYEDSRRSTKQLYDDLNKTKKLQDELRNIYNTSAN